MLFLSFLLPIIHLTNASPYINFGTYLFKFVNIHEAWVDNGFRGSQFQLVPSQTGAIYLQSTALLKIYLFVDWGKSWSFFEKSHIKLQCDGWRDRGQRDERHIVNTTYPGHILYMAGNKNQIKLWCLQNIFYK